MKIPVKAGLGAFYLFFCLLVIGTLVFPTNTFFTYLLLSLLASGIFALSARIAVCNPLQRLTERVREGLSSPGSPSLYTPDEFGELARGLDAAFAEIRAGTERFAIEGARVRVILSSLSEGIAVADEKQRIFLANRAFREFFPTDLKIEGSRPVEVIRNEEIQDIVADVLQGGKTLERILAVQQPEEKLFALTVVPIVEHGKIRGAVLVFRDNTGLRRVP